MVITLKLVSDVMGDSRQYLFGNGFSIRHSLRSKADSSTVEWSVNRFSWFAMRDAGSNPATVTFYRRSPIGRDNGLKIRPVWVRVPSAVFVPVA